MTKFLIYISNRYGIPIGQPLQKEIEKRGFLVKWFSDEEETKNYLTPKEVLLKNTKEVLEFNPDVVLVSSNIVPDFFPGIKVQIFHGFSVAKRSETKGHFNIRGFFDLYCTQGPNTTQPFIQLKKHYKYFEVVETGWSKMDILFPLKPLKDKLKPTILISSTFTKRLSLTQNQSVMNEIKKLSKTEKWNIITILHPKIDKETVEKFKQLENDNFKFHDTTNLIPLFRQADIMLADTTSAISEFLLQKKPVVTINNNKPKNYMINIRHANEIEKALKYALLKPRKLMENIEQFIQETHPYNDGKSSKRVIDACLDFLENKEVKRKPFNFIRRYKIRKKLHHWI